MERRHDIDWLRVIAIGLLLIYHIAIIFQPWAMMVGFMRSEESIESLWTPMSMLNVWRIPLLFYVSGMGVYFAIQKRNWHGLLLERSKRILLPLLFGAVAIVPLHIFVFQQYQGLPLSYFSHTAHLWFLGNIFAYVLLLLPIFYFLKRNENSRLKSWLSSFMSNPISPVAVSLFFIVELWIVKPPIFAMYAHSWHGFFYGLIAFFFGFIFVFCGKAFWHTVKKWKWAYIVTATILYLIRWTAFELSAPNPLMALESNLWILGVFGLGYQYLNKPSAVLNYLSQSVYPIYIIHMVVLYIGASIILPLEIPVSLKLLGIIAFTFIVCYLVFELILRRVELLKPFFGMKWDFKGIFSKKKVQTTDASVDPEVV